MCGISILRGGGGIGGFAEGGGLFGGGVEWDCGGGGLVKDVMV